MRDSKASKEQIEKRRTMADDFEVWRQEIAQRMADEKERRLALRGGIDTDTLETNTIEEETIEFLESVEETVIDE